MSDRRVRARTAGIAAAVITVVVTGTAVAGTGIGGVMNLGVTNSVDKLTTLTGTAAGALLRVANKGNGPALELRVTKPGQVPFRLSSGATGRVRHLNADQVDGLDAAQLQRRVSTACAVGSTISGINADGSVACDADSGTRGRVTSLAPLSTGDGAAVAVPLSGGGAFGQPAGQTLVQTVAAVRIINPAACSAMFVTHFTLDLFLDGAPAGSVSSFFAPAKAGTTETIDLSLPMVRAAPGADAPHTITATAADGCGTAGQSYTVDAIVMDLIFVG